MRVTGIVKWYSQEKGFGFLEVEGVGDVLVHRAVLREAGIALIKEGATVECEAIEPFHLGDDGGARRLLKN